MPIRVPDTLTVDNSEKYKVSIRLWPDGLSFSGYIPAEKDSFFSETIFFDDDMDIAKSLKDIVFENPCFSYLYKSFYVIIITRKYTLVPDDVFSEKRSDMLFSFCHEKDEAGKVLIQQIDDLNLSLLYEVNNDIFEFLTRSILNPRFIHYLAPLFISWQKKSFACYSKQIYAYMHENIFDIICFERGEVLFVNSFNYEKDNDIIYYIMYACRQISINQLEDNLYFCGDVAVCQSAISVIKKYIAKTDYLPPMMENYSLSPGNKHMYLDVTTLVECVL